MTAVDDPTPDTPREQALHWFARQRLGAMAPDEQREFEAWLRNPEHAQAYRSLQDLWRVADHLPMDDMRAIMERGDDDRPWAQRRRMLVGAGAVCASVAVAGLSTRSLWMPEPNFVQHVATARGERRQVRLPDGSLIDLNTDTVVAIAFYDACRTVELRRGEALFSVSADKKRPFLVNAGDSRVRVTGTQFNVRRDGDRTMVAVSEGAVEFSVGAWWQRKIEQVRAGQVSLASPESGLVSPYLERIDAITAWQRGRLVFRDAPLSEVAAELSRYLHQPLHVADMHVARLRVSGTLSIETPEAILDILPQIAPVAVIRGAQGDHLLVTR